LAERAVVAIALISAEGATLRAGIADADERGSGGESERGSGTARETDAKHG
jgi:hypothetical protein